MRFVVFIAFSLCLLGCSHPSVSPSRALTFAGGSSAGALAGYSLGDKSPIGTALGAIGGGLVTNALLGPNPEDLQDAFNEGYVQASSDAIKRQYWIKQFNERGNDEFGRMAYYSIPAATHTRDGRELVEHELLIPILE